MVCTSLGIATIAYAGLGLRTTFVRLHLIDIPAGSRQNLGDLVGRPFEVRNESSMPLTVRVDPEPARSGLLLPGYKPMPAASWLWVEPQEFAIPPGQTRSAKVYLAVPNDPNLVGEHLQGALWIHSVGGNAIQIGLRTKVPFTVGAKGAKPRSETPN